MDPPIVFDGLRLLLNNLTPTPRGIDRVDFGYARFLFETYSQPCFGLLPTPWGVRLFDQGRVLRLLDSIETVWRESRAHDPDQAFEVLRRWLIHGGADYGNVRRVLRQRRGWPTLLWRCLQANGLAWGRSAINNAPKGAVYLNVGQLGWATPFTTSWLGRRPDIRAIFMLHDVIPLQHPQLVSKGGRLSQDWMLRAVKSHAAGLITTTQAATEVVTHVLRRHSFPPVPVLALHLPIDDVFQQSAEPDPELPRHNYFVVCGAIEPRKNHLLLLEVWRLLVQRLGQAAPRLVILGSAAHDGTKIIKRLYNESNFRGHVILLSGMASPKLRQVMASATAVLMPSLAEGFGLPIAEALALGTPVLASDLPAHREVGGKLGIYLDPKDPSIWFDAIMDLIDMKDETVALRTRISGYRPMSHADYFKRLTEFLAGFRQE